METTSGLVMGVDAFSGLDLLRKATEHKGLTLRYTTTGFFESEPIRAYELDGKLLAILAERGFKGQVFRLHDRNGIFTLVDESPRVQDHRQWEANHSWDFKSLEGDGHKFDMHVSIEVGINVREDGVVLWVIASGSNGYAANEFSDFRLFKALAERDEDAPAIVKELAASEWGVVIITWADLGLKGMRDLNELFSNSVLGKNEVVERLISRIGFLDPCPSFQHQKPGDKLFITKRAQRRVIKAWRAQLEEYRNSLSV